MFLNQSALNRKIEFDALHLPERAKEDIIRRYNTLNLIHNRGYHLTEQQRRLYLANRPINKRYDSMNSGAPSFSGMFENLNNNILASDYTKPILPSAYIKYQKLLDIVYQQNILNKKAKTMTLIDLSQNKYVAGIAPNIFTPSTQKKLDGLIRNILNNQIYMLFYNDPTNPNLIRELQQLTIGMISDKNNDILHSFDKLNSDIVDEPEKLNTNINPENIKEQKEYMIFIYDLKSIDMLKKLQNREEMNFITNKRIVRDFFDRLPNTKSLIGKALHKHIKTIKSNDEAEIGRAHV